MEIDSRGRKILAAAEEIMSRKGLYDSTIGEIAEKAGVADSVIYKYFKNKEDLLFSIPGERMKEVLIIADEQLQGIKDAESRLGKIIWWYLRYNDEHPGYIRILLLECRSRNDFYESEAYKLIRKFSGIILGILEKGVKDGQFRNDISMRLVREIIFGSLDFEVIGVLASKERKDSVSDFEDLMSLILSIITKKAGQEQQRIEKAEMLCLAAENVFAEKGYEKAKVLEIAKKANVSEGTVYEYFKNKEDLLFAISIRRFNEYLDTIPQMFNIRNPVRKLRRLIKYNMSFFLKERNFMRVFLLQMQLNKNFYESSAYENFKRYIQVLEDIVEEGKIDGSFRSDVNTRVFRNMFIGALNHIGLRWLIFGKDHQFDKMEEIEELTDLLCSALISNEKL